jgi:hypothetical protein
MSLALKQAIHANDDTALGRVARNEGYVTMAERALRLIMDGKVDQRVLDRLPRTDVDAIKITNDAFNAMLEESVNAARAHGKGSRRNTTALHVVEP